MSKRGFQVHGRFLEVGSDIDYFDGNTWHLRKVAKFSEARQCVKVTSTSHWLPLDSALIAPPGTHTRKNTLRKKMQTLTLGKSSGRQFQTRASSLSVPCFERSSSSQLEAPKRHSANDSIQMDIPPMPTVAAPPPPTETSFARTAENAKNVENAEVSNSNKVTFNVQKVLKRGMQVSRTFVIDKALRSVQVFENETKKGELRSEFATSSIEKVEVTDVRGKQIFVKFTDSSGMRSTTLRFSHASEMTIFVNLLCRLSEKNVDTDAPALLEYNVVKLNRFGRSQQRILVVHPAEGLRLLDAQHKIRKAFAFDSIALVETESQTQLSTEEGVSDAAVHITFTTASQRPFRAAFRNAFERRHFCAALRSFGVAVVAAGVNDGEVFPVTKCHTSRRKSRRMFYLPKENMDVVYYIKAESAMCAIDLRSVKLQRCQQRRRLALTTTFTRIFEFATARASEAFLALLTRRQLRLFLPQFDQMKPQVRLLAVTWNLGDAPCIVGSPDDMQDAVAHATAHKRLYAQSHSLSDDVQVENEVVNYFTRVIEPCSLENLLGACNSRNDVVFVTLQEMRRHDKEATIARIREFLEKRQQTEVDVLATESLRQICAVVFVPRSLLPFVTCLRTHSVACGIGDIVGNKGCACVSFSLLDTRITLIGAHLAARAERLQRRHDDAARVLAQLTCLPIEESDELAHWSPFDADLCVFAGDLNYRIAELDFASSVKATENLQNLAKHDQLSRALSAVPRPVFSGFEEGEFWRFKPTYRMERHCDAYNNKRDQSASWTDRVLFLRQHATDTVTGKKDSGGVELLKYDAAHSMLGSDHRPVYAQFCVQLKKPLNSVDFATSRAQFSVKFVEGCTVKLFSHMLLRRGRKHVRSEEEIRNAEVQLRFTSPALSAETTTCAKRHSASDGKTLIWHFGNASLADSLIGGSATFLQRSFVHVSLLPFEAEARLSLRSVFTQLSGDALAKQCCCEVPVHLDGVQVGVLKATLSGVRKILSSSAQANFEVK
ncbi:MAG: hypothetical protein MHM6MM_004100 [Cercozoa sp. M6MM]